MSPIQKAASKEINKKAGFTLIEIIMVVSVIGIAYFYAIPQFNIITGTETAEKLGKLSEDVRSAYDMAVLHGKPHRMVFMLATGEYWLEVADRRDVLIGDEKLPRDLTAEEEKNAEEEFKQAFAEYESLAGQEYKDSRTETTIKPFSPVITAKDQLRPPKWTRVDNMEWGGRTLGPNFIFKSFQAEHHATKQTFESLGEQARAMLYFFPSGYVEQCVMHIAFRKGAYEIDPDQEPYTVIINSAEGTASVTSGETDYEFKAHDEV